MARLTITQALFSNSSGLSIQDTAANILRAAANPALLQRVTQFNLTANATVSAASAQILAGLGRKFSLNGHQLTVQDSVAALSDPGNLGALGLATSIVAADTADHLLAAVGGTVLHQVQAVTLSTSAVLDAAGYVSLESLPGFSVASGQTITIADTVANLLTLTSVPMLPAVQSVQVTANATINVASLNQLFALPNVTLQTGAALTAEDSLANLSGLSPAEQQVVHDVVVHDTVAALVGATALPTGTIGIVAVLDNGSYTVAQARALLAFGQPLTLLPSQGAATLQITDTQQHITDGHDALASLEADGPVTVTPNDQSSVLTAAQAAALSVVSPGLSVQDTAPAISGLAGQIFGKGFASITATSGTLSGTATQLLDPTLHYGSSSNSLLSTLSQSSGSSVPVNAQLTGASTVDAAHLTALSVLPGFSVAPGATLTVADTIGALIAASGLIHSFATAVLATDNETMTAAAATVLAGLSAAVGSAQFSLGGHTVTISDDGANLAAPGNAAGLALASAVTLSAASIVNASQAAHLIALGTVFSTGGMSLTISDTAANLATLASSASTLNGWGAQLQLAADVTLTVAAAHALQAFSTFGPGSPHLTIADTAASLLAAGAGTLALAGKVQLSQPATLTAATATALLALPAFSTAGQTVTIADTAAHLASLPGTLTNWAAAETLLFNVPSDAIVTATQFTALLALPHLTSITGLTVADTAANLLAASTVLGQATHIQLSTQAALTVTQAEALIGQANFQTGAALSIADTVPNLLTLAGAVLPNHTTILQATPIGLSADATVTVAQMAALQALPEYTLFSRNGHALILSDSGKHLAAFVPDTVAPPTSYVLAGDTTLTTAQANILAARSVTTNDNAVTVADTPSALLDAGNSAGLALASAITLSGDATATAAQTSALFANPYFNTGGHALTVSDTAAAILGLSPSIDAAVTTLALAASQTVDVATLLGLTQLGIKFSLAGHTLTVADTAANLATLNSLETSLTSAEVLTTSASVNAVTATLLAALPHFSLAPGATLTIVDTEAALAALPLAVSSIATSEQLAPGSTVTLTVAQALILVALPGFSNAGSTIVVSDTLAHLAANGWQSIATGYIVKDNAEALVAQAGG